MKMDKEEEVLLDSVEKGEWKCTPGHKKEAKRYQEAARSTLRKDKRVNIRMTERDLVRFQKAAVHEGCLIRHLFPVYCISTLRDD
jgi:predicted DNA binding CopG/RHH family protein